MWNLEAMTCCRYTMHNRSRIDWTPQVTINFISILRGQVHLFVTCLFRAHCQDYKERGFHNLPERVSILNITRRSTFLCTSRFWMLWSDVHNIFCDSSKCPAVKCIVFVMKNWQYLRNKAVTFFQIIFLPSTLWKYLLKFLRT